MQGEENIRTAKSAGAVTPAREILQHKIQELAGRISERAVTPLGFPPLDDAIGGGLIHGGVHEIFSPDGLHISLLLPLISRLTKEGKSVALIEEERRWYPPAFALAGIDLHRVPFILPQRHRDALWTVEQCIASPAVALTLAQVSGLREMELRRYALMAERGGNLCVLLRATSEIGSYASATLRLDITPTMHRGHNRAFQVTVLRCRGAIPPQPMLFEINDHEQAMAVHPSAGLPLSTHREGNAAASA